MSIKISQLPAATSAAAADELPANQAGTTRKVTVGQLLEVTGGVNVKSFGAVGNDVADDTAAFQAAFATGKPVVVPPGTYRLTAGLTFAATGQSCVGVGLQSRLRPIGNFDVFTTNGPTQHTYVENLWVLGSLLTGGYVVNANDGDRVFMKHLRLDSCWGLARFIRCNVFHAEDIYVQSPRGPFCFRGEGTTLADRCDVIRLIDVNIGGPNTCLWTGLSIDGPVSTVQMDRVTMVNYNRGIHTTANASQSLFIFANDFEADFGLNEAVRLEAGGDFWFQLSYFQGAGFYGGAGENLIWMGPNVRNLRISNSYVTTARAECIYIAGNDVTISDSEVLLPGWKAGGAPAGTLGTDAIRIAGTASRVRIVGCQIGGRENVGLVARYGVNVENGAREVQMIGNTVYGCWGGPVLDNSGASAFGAVQVLGVTNGVHALNQQTAGVDIGVRDGQGALASATIVGGQITAIAVDSGGAGYTLAPTVAIFDSGGGVGATATAAIDGGGAVTSITVTNGGSGYSAGTVVVLYPQQRTPVVRANATGAPNSPISLLAAGTGSALIGNARGVAFGAAPAEASSVNYLFAQGRATGNFPVLFTTGPDANIGINVTAKGNARILLANNEGNMAAFRTAEASAVNFLGIRGRATTLAPDIVAEGTDANIDIAMTPKGTGRLRFGTHTANADAPITGYIEVKDSAGNIRKLAIIA